MSENYELGKKGKFGSFDFSKIKSGITREELLAQKNEFAAIFDMIDTDKNSTLSRKELSVFMQQADKNADLIVSDAEISNLGKASKLDIKNFKEVFAGFFSEISNIMKKSGIVTVETAEDNTEIIKYENGVEEKVNEDGSKEIIIKEGQCSLVQKYDSEGNLLEENAEVDSGADGKVIAKRTYENGKIKKTETVSYDSEGKVLEKVTERHDEKITERFIGDRVVKITEKSGEIQTLVTQNNFVIYEGIEKDGVFQEISYDLENQIKNIIVTEGDKKTINIQTLDGKNLYQVIKTGDQELYIQYDGNGNTYLVVQNGENIVENFNLEDKLDQLAGLNKSSYYNKPWEKAGEVVLIPGELQADDARLQGRKSAESVRADYTMYANKVMSEYGFDAFVLFQELTSDAKTYKELADDLIRSEVSQNNDYIYSNYEKLLKSDNISGEDKLKFARAFNLNYDELTASEKEYLTSVLELVIYKEQAIDDLNSFIKTKHMKNSLERKIKIIQSQVYDLKCKSGGYLDSSIKLQEENLQKILTSFDYEFDMTDVEYTNLVYKIEGIGDKLASIERKLNPQEVADSTMVDKSHIRAHMQKAEQEKLSKELETFSSLPGADIIGIRRLIADKYQVSPMLLDMRTRQVKATLEQQGIKEEDIATTPNIAVFVTFPGSLLLRDINELKEMKITQDKYCDLRQAYLNKVNEGQEIYFDIKTYYNTHKFSSGDSDLSKLTSKLDASNIYYFFNASRDEGYAIVDIILDEGCGDVNNSLEIKGLLNKLYSAAQKSGIPEEIIDKVDVNYNSKSSVKNYVKYLMSLMILQAEKENRARDIGSGAEVADITLTDAEAAQFISEIYSEQLSSAEAQYKEIKDEYCWVTESVQQLFAEEGEGFYDIGGKISNNRESFENLKLATEKIANAKTTDELNKAKAEFNTYYKEIFGVDYNKENVEEANAFMMKYQQVVGLQKAEELYIDLENQVWNSETYEDVIETVVNGISGQNTYSQEEIESLVAQYVGIADFKDIPNKKEALAKWLEQLSDIQKALRLDILEGKTVEELEKDVNTVMTSAFGPTGDNLTYTQTLSDSMEKTSTTLTMVTEIAIMVAMQFIPGGVAIAAARLASLANKASKFYKACMTLSKGFKAFNTYRASGSLARRVAVGSVYSGVTDITAQGICEGQIDLKRTSKTMLLGGLGVSNSAVATKLFSGFADNRTVRVLSELTETMMSAGESVGVEYLYGNKYTDSDFALDVIMDMSIALVSGRFSKGANRTVREEWLDDSGNLKGTKETVYDGFSQTVRYIDNNQNVELTINNKYNMDGEIIEISVKNDKVEMVQAIRDKKCVSATVKEILPDGTIKQDIYSNKNQDQISRIEEAFELSSKIVVSADINKITSKLRDAQTLDDYNSILSDLNKLPESVYKNKAIAEVLIAKQQFEQRPDAIVPTEASIKAAAGPANKVHLMSESDIANFYDTLTPEQKAIVDSYGIAYNKDKIFDICGILRLKMSDYDTPATIESRYAQAYSRAKNGVLDVDSYLDNNDISEIKDIAYSLMDAAKKERKLVIITGRAGGGKSTIAKNLGLTQDYYFPDADELKAFLPGYKEYGAGYVHPLSVKINTVLVENAFENGVNTVFQTTGWEGYVDEIITKAKEAGYTIELVHTDVSTENSISRSVSRANSSGRTVDPASIEASAEFIDNLVVHSARVNHEELSRIQVYDNNGSGPVLVEEIHLGY